MTPKKIKLGICMAGAVSAGAYTAGVVDYLMETLERWQIEKDRIRQKLSRNEDLTELEKAVPLHDVEIEVLSGASAGGMTASILTYALLDKTHFTKRGGNEGKLISKSYGVPVHSNVKSKLYQSWVEMDDDDRKTTLDKMLDNSDVTSILKMKSALNCDPITEIANRACPQIFPQSIKFPEYVSSELTSYVTVTNLRGLPIDVTFSNSEESRNQYTMHSMVIGFKFGENKDLPFPCMEISSGNFKKIKDFAIATGAFPFGLRPHPITLSNDVMMEYARTVKRKYNMDIAPEAYHGHDYSFYAVDGGLLNNESYGVNANHLKMANADVDTNFMIYIDPFPSITNITQNNSSQEVEPILSNLFFKLFGAARNQSMLKQDDLSSLLDMEQNRFIIYPRKNRIYFLACGMMEGFSGFLNKKFRQHDYQLGRKNCQAFLRYYFGKEESYFNEHDLPLNLETINRFGYAPDRDNSKSIRIPIIPDMLFLESNEAPEIAIPTFENLTQKEYDEIMKKLGKRVTAIVRASYTDLTNKLSSKKIIRFLVFLSQPLGKKFLARKTMQALDSLLEKIVRPQSISQENLIKNYASVVKEMGKMYFKHGKVFIRKALPNEKVISVTSSGFETEKFAEDGHYVLTNLATRSRECYLIKQHTYEKYELVDAIKGEYKMKSGFNIHAVKFDQQNFPKLFSGSMKKNEFGMRYIYIEAAWGESQVLIENDYLALNGDEIYRIGKLEFEQTYRAV